MLKTIRNECEIKKSDIVTRKSYGQDILFIVKKIIKSNNCDLAILKGCTLRIEASAPLNDLLKVNKKEFQNAMRNLDYRIDNRIADIKNPKINRKVTNEKKEFVYTGKILHLDGDRKYSEKAVKYYKKMGLNAIVREI